MRFSLLTTWLLCGLFSVSAQDTSLETVEEAFQNANASLVMFPYDGVN